MRKSENYAFAIWTTRGESETGGTAMDEEKRRAKLGGSQGDIAKERDEVLSRVPPSCS